MYHKRRSLQLERLEDRRVMDGAGFINTDPPEDPDSIVGVAEVEAHDDHRETSRGTIQLRIDPLQNDLLPEGSESFRIKSVSDTRLGHSVEITEDGRGLIYDAGEAGLQASDTFYYIVETDDGKLGKANVNLTLKQESSSGGGTIPTYTTNDYYYIFEDADAQELDVLANDREFRSGEIVAVSSYSSHNQGSIKIAEDGKSLIYKPREGFSGTEYFHYTVRKADGEEATAQVRINVNKPVSIESQSSNSIDDSYNKLISEILYRVGTSTPITPALEIVDAPEYAGEFTIASDGKRITYQPADDFLGTFRLEYKVTYGTKDYQFATGHLLYNVQSSFLAVDNWFNVEPESSETQLNVLENDLTWKRYLKINGQNQRLDPVQLKIDSVSAGDQGGQLRIADDGKSVFYQPAAGFTGDETFIYEVLASNGVRDTATVTVHVAESVADSSGVDTFVNEDELRQFLIDKAASQYARQFGVTEQRYAPLPDDWYSHWDYSITTFLTNDATVVTAADHSETNTQVSGVDEADIVETDGHYVYTFFDGKLAIVDVSDPEAPVLESMTEFEGRFDAMYLQGDRMTLLRSGSQYGSSDAELLVLDISDRSAPEILERTEIDGYIADSRAIGDRVHLVVKRNFDLPELGGNWLVEPVLPEESIDQTQVNASDSGLSGSTTLLIDSYYPINRGEPGIWVNETFDEYVARVKESLLFDTGLPSFNTYNAEGEMVDSGFFTEPTSIHKPVVGSDQLVTLVTFDAGDDQAGPVADGTSFVSDSNIDVFVSAEAAYVFAHVPATSTTNIYKLSLEEDGTTPIVASGEIGGKLLNQFSADEYDGYLRVATTEIRYTEIETSWGTRQVQSQRFNNVLVLEQEGNQLNTVGEVTNLAPTETIHSVRFMGDRAYVVTFRVVDPLFALDMSDPTRPTVEGALKIPGFSNYLHPVGSDYLLGIGRDADEITGQLGPMQITLFDVSDLSDPKVADQVTFEGDDWAHTEAWIDHHAVSYFAESGVLAIPLSWREQVELSGEEAAHFGTTRTENHSAIWTFQVDVENPEGASITATGKVEHEGPSYGRWIPQPGFPFRGQARIVTDAWWGWNYDPGSPARRALRVGESLITVSNEYVKINHLHDPNIEISEVYLGKLAQDDHFILEEDSGYNKLKVRDNDLASSDGKAPIIVDVSQPVEGGTVKVSQNGKTVRFKPEKNFFGNVTFTYTTFDEVRGEETATVTLTVQNTPDAPKAKRDRFPVAVDSGATVLDVLANDINLDAGSVQFTPYIKPYVNSTVSYSNSIDNVVYLSIESLRVEEISEPDNGGTVQFDDWGRVLYTPAEGFEGFETFQYTVVNGSGLKDVGTVRVKVGNPKKSDSHDSKTSLATATKSENILDLYYRNFEGRDAETEELLIYDTPALPQGSSFAVDEAYSLIEVEESLVELPEEQESFVSLSAAETQLELEESLFD